MFDGIGGPGFHDHFSGHAAEYAAFRPSYPAALFDALVRLAPARDLAWDCATGSGQAAVPLAGHVARVAATDASEAQLAHATRHPGVRYAVARAEAAPLRSGSADLVTVAQAAHWLDLGAFYREARRVLRPGGAIALWCYGLAEISPEVDPIVARLYGETLDGYWSPERRLVEDGYRSIPFPFDEVALPALAIEGRMTLAEFTGYLRTWSAVRRHLREAGTDPVAPVEGELGAVWGADERRLVRWPLGIRAGRTDR